MKKKTKILQKKFNDFFTFDPFYSLLNHWKTIVAIILHFVSFKEWEFRKELAKINYYISSDHNFNSESKI